MKTSHTIDKQITWIETTAEEKNVSISVVFSVWGGGGRHLTNSLELGDTHSVIKQNRTSGFCFGVRKLRGATFNLSK